MMMIYEMNGMKTECEAVDYKEFFTEIFNDSGEMFLLSKEEFKHEEDELTFFYRYGINAYDVQELSGEEGAPVVVELVLVPSPVSVHQEILDDLGDTMGWEEDESEEIMYWDLVRESYGVVMERVYLEDLPEDDRYNLLDLEEVVKTLDSMAVFYSLIDNMRGFNLDKAWNRIGTNGWDSLNHMILNEPIFKF